VGDEEFIEIVAIRNRWVWNEWPHIGVKRYVSNNVSGCISFHDGKLKNQIERTGLDNFGMDWKRKPRT